MQVRLGTACGFNLLLLVRWTHEEVLVPVADNHGAVTQPADAAPLVDEETETYGVPTPPEPISEVTTSDTPVAQETSKTLCLYFSGQAEPVVLTGEEAAAVLGVLVANSGSLI